MKRWLRIVLFLCLGGIASLAAQEKELTLDQCVDIAIQQNPDIVMGEFTMKIAGKDVIGAVSNFLPDVSCRLGYYHSVVGPSSALRVDPGTGIPVPLQPNEIVSWASTASASVNQSLLNSYNYFYLRQSMHLKKSADFTFEDTKQSTIYVVKERYYNLLKAEKLLEVAEETIKSSEESFKRAEVLYEVGKAPRSDVLKAKVQLEQDRLSLIETQNGLSIARASLNHILGFDVNQTIKVVDNLDVSEMEVSLEEAMASAVAKHPALKKGEYDVKAAKAAVGASISEYLPNLYGYYQYSWSNRDFKMIDNMFDTDYNWYMGATLSIPIFQGLSRVANLSKANLMKKSNMEALEQYQRDIALEVKQSLFEVQQAKKKIAVTQNALDASEEDLRLNKEKYSLGAGTILDLINAQVSYTQAQSDNIQAKYDYKYTIARLQKAMGVLTR